MREFSSIPHGIASHAKYIPNKIAIIEAEADRKCTYGELWSYVQSFSKRLNAVGVKRDFGDGYGTRVVVRCTQTIDFIVAMLAIHLAGGVFVPVEKNIADSRIIEIMEETDSKILIAEKPLTDADYCYKYIQLTDATAGQDLLEEEIQMPPPDSLANILYTTGTTGKSKGVMQSHGSLTSYFLTIYSAFEHDHNQVWLLPNPLSHGNGIYRVFISLYFQCTVVLLDGYALAKPFFAAIEKYKVTIINFISSALEIYLRIGKVKLEGINNQIACISLASSSFSESQIKSLRKIFPKSKIIQTYGATEVMACVIDHAHQQYALSCLGRPYRDTELVFFDMSRDEIIETSRSTLGLIGVNNKTKMLGYWKNPELTESITRGKYIVLSDLGYKGEDGLVYFAGRSDDIITSGGYKIAPFEIEEVAESFAGIRESACVAVEDQIMGEVPKLFVVMEDGHAFDYTEIYNFIKTKLETTKIPRYIEEIEAIPKIGGKKNRKGLIK